MFSGVRFQALTSSGAGSVAVTFIGKMPASLFAIDVAFEIEKFAEGRLDGSHGVA